MTKKTDKKAAKNNVIPLPKKKKKDNITLDKNDAGSYITTIEHYKTRDLERFLTIDDVLLLIPKELKKRSWVNWREINKDLPRNERIGPEYAIFGKRIYKIKVIWVLRYIKGCNWEPEVQAQVSATQSNDKQLRSSEGL